jgi:hypothetical protein
MCKNINRNNNQKTTERYPFHVSIIFHFNDFGNIFSKIRKIAHNVPAIYDFFASPGNHRFPGLAKKWVEGGVGMERSGMT